VKDMEPGLTTTDYRLEYRCGASPWILDGYTISKHRAIARIKDLKENNPDYEFLILEIVQTVIVKI
jgi:hypothetical protein